MIVYYPNNFEMQWEIIVVVTTYPSIKKTRNIFLKEDMIIKNYGIEYITKYNVIKQLAFSRKEKSLPNKQRYLG